MKKKVTYIVSDIDKSIAFEWIVEQLNKKKIDLSFILINKASTSHLHSYLKENNIPVFQLYFSDKKKLPVIIFKCFLLLKKINPDIVHCHLFWANIIGLTASKLSNIKNRIFTRHHSTYHHTYFPKAVKWDRLCNFLATDVVAISGNVEDVLVRLEKVPQKKNHKNLSWI